MEETLLLLLTSTVCVLEVGLSDWLDETRDKIIIRIIFLRNSNRKALLPVESEIVLNMQEFTKTMKNFFIKDNYLEYISWIWVSYWLKNTECTHRDHLSAT